MKLFGLIIADAGSFVADLVLKVVVALVSVLVSGIGEVVIEGAYQLVNNFFDPGNSTFSFEGIVNATFLGEKSSVIFSNLYKLSYYIGLAMIMIIILTYVLKAIASGATGEKAENPAYILIRCLGVVLLLFLFNPFGENSLIRYIGVFMDKVIMGFENDIFAPLICGSEYEAVINGEVILVGFDFLIRSLADIISSQSSSVLIFTFILFMTISFVAFSLFLAIVERIVTFAFYIMIGPIAIAMYAGPDTADTAKSWMTGLVTQMLAIILMFILFRIGQYETYLFFKMVGIVNAW